MLDFASNVEILLWSPLPSSSPSISTYADITNLTVTMDSCT